MKKALGYTRVSSTHQSEEGYSLDHQKKAIKEYCKTHNLRLVKTFVDSGKSGRTVNRPEFQSMLELVKEESIDCVIVYKIDRFARNITDFSRIRKDFIKKEISLLSVMEGDVTNGSSLVANLFASVAEWESDVNSQRTKDGMMEKFRSGWQPTPPPLGYVSIGGDRERKTWGVDPNTAPIIKKLFKLYSTGQYSFVDLQEFLADKNIISKNGTPLSHSRINNIINNPAYYGLIRWRGESKIGKHTPLITKQLFESCQYVCAKHRNFLLRRRKHNFLLRGFAYCSCGMKMVAEHHVIRSNKKKIAYYHCQRQHSRTCKEPYTRLSELESQVDDYIQDIQLGDDFKDLVVQQAKDYLNNGKKENKSMIQALINQKMGLEMKRNRLEDLIIDNAIDKDTYQRKHSEVQENIENIQTQIEDAEDKNKLDTDLIKDVITLSNNAYQAYKDADKPLKRHYLRFFYERFTVSKKKIIEAKPTPIFETLLAAKKVRLTTNQLLGLDSNQEPSAYT